ncbi:MAG: rRNA maturation RNase YbeY [Bacteroidota bacterium]
MSKSKQAIDVDFFQSSNVTQPLRKGDIRRIVSHVCRQEHVWRAELSIVLVDDKAIQTMNKHFLGHDYVTDVITFPLEHDRISAEVYINVQQAKRQAKEHGVSVQNEMTRLVVHGTLHALGYDDTTSRKRKMMHTVQERYVSDLS